VELTAEVAEAMMEEERERHRSTLQGTQNACKLSIMNLVIDL
jgi:hypothetical protein